MDVACAGSREPTVTPVDMILRTTFKKVFGRATTGAMPDATASDER